MKVVETFMDDGIAWQLLRCEVCGKDKLVIAGEWEECCQWEGYDEWLKRGGHND